MLNLKYHFGFRISLRVSSCSISSAITRTVFDMNAFQAVWLYSPMPSTNGGTPMMLATVLLSISTLSLMARSARLSGLTVSISNCSAGISHGSPASVDFTY